MNWTRLTTLIKITASTVKQMTFVCEFVFTENTTAGEDLYPNTGQTGNRTSCMSHFDGNCCKEKYVIRIKNCGCFYVYYLRYTTSCNSAYCFGR